MSFERLLVGFLIASLVMVLVSPLRADDPKPRTAVVAPADAPTLLKKLDTLDDRLRDAQTSIDIVLGKLSNASADSERDATRIRLAVLYRLEEGLAHDIAKTRGQLAALGNR